MKKTITLFAFTAICSVLACAQDIIVTTSAQRIEAKILEISKSEIKYKEADNLDGPTFVLGTDDINTIIYANGKVVLYDNKAPHPEQQAPSGQTEQERIAREQAEAAEQERIAQQLNRMTEQIKENNEKMSASIQRLIDVENSWVLEIQNSTKYPYRINLDGNILGVVNPYKVQRFTVQTKTYGRMQAVQTSGYMFSPTIKEFVVPRQQKKALFRAIIK